MAALRIGRRQVGRKNFRKYDRCGWPAAGRRQCRQQPGMRPWSGASATLRPTPDENRAMLHTSRARVSVTPGRAAGDPPIKRRRPLGWLDSPRCRRLKTYITDDMKLLVLSAVVAVALAAPRPEKLDGLVAQQQQQSFHPDRDARILAQLNQHLEDGSYQQSFQTENGIVASEQGVSYPGNEPETGSYVKEGSFEYEADDGTIVVVNYVADENGYEVLNADELAVALPTPPPTQYPPPRVPGAGLPVPQPLPEFNTPNNFAN